MKNIFISIEDIIKEKNKLKESMHLNLKVSKISYPYQIVLNSPWPIILSIILLDFFIFVVSIFYNVNHSSFFFHIAFCLTGITLYFWISELIKEGLYIGDHSKIEVSNLTIGFILFVVSEIIIFIILFFSYFYNSFIPAIEIGSEWPPYAIKIINPYSLPLFNTALLYFSGISISISQNYLLTRNKYHTLFFLLFTIILALLFTMVQLYEYKQASFSILDSIYGTNFFVLTGFHGIHVIIGTSLLIISFLRFFFNHFQSNNQVGYHASAIYWAFVDWLWLFIMAFLYIWSS